MVKQNCRREFRKIRDGLSKSELNAFSDSICSRVLKTDLYRNSDLILCYISVGSEVDTSLIIETAFSDGKAVAVPCCNDCNMTFRLIKSFDDLIIGKFGIPTAVSECDVDFLRYNSVLCIVPCLSVDQNLFRLGYGRGYYDRFLAEHSEMKSVALCFDECLSCELPVDAYDVPVNMAITENNVLGGV